VHSTFFLFLPRFLRFNVFDFCSNVFYFKKRAFKILSRTSRSCFGTNIYIYNQWLNALIVINNVALRWAGYYLDG